MPLLIHLISFWYFLSVCFSNCSLPIHPCHTVSVIFSLWLQWRPAPPSNLQGHLEANQIVQRAPSTPKRSANHHARIRISSQEVERAGISMSGRGEKQAACQVRDRYVCTLVCPPTCLYSSQWKQTVKDGMSVCATELCKRDI